jgi:hypothetical protein
MKNNIWVKDIKQNKVYFGSIDTQLIGSKDYPLREATEEETKEAILKKSKDIKIHILNRDKTFCTNYNDRILDLVAELVLSDSKDQEIINSLKNLYQKKLDISIQHNQKLEKIKEANSLEELEKINWDFPKTD